MVPAQKLVALALLATPVVSQTITRAEAIKDLDFLVHTIEKIHPDPYAVRPAAEATAERDRILADLPATMTKHELWLKLAAFVAGYRDAHTSLDLPPFPDNPSYFPAEVQWMAEGIVVTDEPPEGVARGDRIVRINGQDPVALLQAWKLTVSAELEPTQRYQAAGTFRSLLHIRGMESPYTLQIIGPDGVQREVVLQGIKQEELGPARPAPQYDVDNPVFQFRMLTDDAGYMAWQFMVGNLERFERDVSRMMTVLNEHHAQTLIVDLRVNYGGRFDWEKVVLDHFARHPYKDLEGDGKIVTRSNLPRVMKWLGLEYVFFPIDAWRYRPGTLIHADALSLPAGSVQPFFSGNVCVLTGPGSFSAAVEFANIIQTYRLGTIIGEETGGAVNAHGRPLFFQLPKSGIQGHVANARYRRPDGDKTSIRGVVPDIPVMATINDIRAGRDPVLERAMSCPAIP
jgi:hypothetical protein